MMIRRLIFFGLFIMRTVSSSIGSESEPLLTCSKFHFEEKVLEKLIRLEQKVAIYEETIKRWENTFVSKLENLDEVQRQSNTLFKSMQAVQLQEEIRINILKEESAKIKTLERHVADNNKKVAFTACVSRSQKFSDYIVKFSIVPFPVGIHNINTFKSSGKFVCEIPGLYYITAHIRTNTKGAAIYVRKNGSNVGLAVSDTVNSYSTIPISAVVELQLKDILDVYASHYISAPYSCLSLMKLL